MTRFLGLAYADSAKAKAANKKLCCYPLGTKLFNKATAARSVDSFHDNIAEVLPPTGCRTKFCDKKTAKVLRDRMGGRAKALGCGGAGVDEEVMRFFW